MSTIAKSHRPEAERAAEWCLREKFGCVVTRRALRTKFAKVDFFAADVIGKMVDGANVYAQATAGQDECVRLRRRKLEKVPWHTDERVLVLQLVERQSPVNARSKEWFFRVHEYSGAFRSNDERVKRDWMDVCEAIPVPREWFKAWRDEQ